VAYRGENMYNVLLAIHGQMTVNGMETETLDPTNLAGIIYVMMSKATTVRNKKLITARFRVAMSNLKKKKIARKHNASNGV